MRLVRMAGAAASVAAVVLVFAASAFADSRTVKMRDDCDPATFNLFVPATPPTCVGDGQTKFLDFIGQLADHKFAAAWRFSSDNVTIESGRSLRIENRGGETHSFTLTTSFAGGGIVGPINKVLFGTETPQTFFFGPLNLVPSGGRTTIGPDVLTPGPHMFMCVIHPWMHETVLVENGDDD